MKNDKIVYLVEVWEDKFEKLITEYQNQLDKDKEELKTLLHKIYISEKAIEDLNTIKKYELKLKNEER